MSLEVDRNPDSVLRHGGEAAAGRASRAGDVESAMGTGPDTASEGDEAGAVSGAAASGVDVRRHLCATAGGPRRQGRVPLLGHALGL